MEFWDTVGSEYMRRVTEARERFFSENNMLNVKNYIQELHEVLLPEIMQTIIILDQNDMEFPELRSSGVKTLTTCVGCGNR